MLVHSFSPYMSLLLLYKLSLIVGGWIGTLVGIDGVVVSGHILER